MAHDPRRSLIEKLPASEMVYPDAILHRIKYYLWYFYAPYHPTVRDSVIALNVVKNYGRQPYLLGKIAPQFTMEEFISFLVEKGYAYHRVAWEDEGEVVSLRHVKNFIHQYHVRIFEDGEVRGHYEYTPECYPLLHLFDIGSEDRREEFMEQFGDKLIPHTSDDPFDSRWEFLPGTKRLLSRISLLEEVPDAPNRSSTDQR